MFKDNPKYTLQGSFNGIDVYTCAKDTDYHMMRYVEALNWQTFAASGITKEKLQGITDAMINICEEENNKVKVRTDIAALARLIQYCLKYPVEEQCGLHLGCMLSFIDGENPDKIEDLFQRKKLDLAMSNPDAYAFFLGWGIANIPEYRNQLDILTASTYLIKRRQDMQAILPDYLKHLMS